MFSFLFHSSAGVLYWEFTLFSFFVSLNRVIVILLSSLSGIPNSFSLVAMTEGLVHFGVVMRPGFSVSLCHCFGGCQLPSFSSSIYNIQVGHGGGGVGYYHYTNVTWPVNNSGSLTSVLEDK